MPKKRIPRSHKTSAVGIVRYDIDSDEFWLDFSTISGVSADSKLMAEKAEREIPRFYAVHPAAGVYKLMIEAVPMEEF